MAGGHDGRTAVAQVSDQESDLTPYRRLLFEARSSRITVSRNRDRTEFGNNCSMATVARDRLRARSIGAGAMRRSALYAGLFVLVGMTGCAQTNHPAVSTQAPPTAVPGSAGTILWMRSVAEPSGSAPWRTALLAIAAKTSAADGGEAAPLVEFIVRADDGAILSVVQGNDVGLRPGDRVVILYEGSTHLARPG
jgi:hypothetical protein